MVSVRHLCFDRLDVTAQLLGDDDTWFAKPGNQSLEKPLCCLSVSAGLDQNIKNVACRINWAPQPVALSTDCDDHFIYVPLIVRSWPIPPDAICQVATKTIYPQPDRFPTDNNNTPRSQQILNIRRAQRQPVVRPDRKAVFSRG